VCESMDWGEMRKFAEGEIERELIS
jgi:hypothetical protein